MRLSLPGSVAAFGSTYSSRRPFPLMSMISAVHPCAFSSSPVSSHSFVFNHPTTGPPPLVQRVRLAFSANIGLCAVALLVQIGSVPQYGDGPATCGGDAGGMFGSRSVTGTRVAV